MTADTIASAPVPCVCGNDRPTILAMGNAHAEAWCIACRDCEREVCATTRAGALRYWAEQTAALAAKEAAR